MEFAWDPTKALTNLRKHGVRFEMAVLAFDDPHAILLRDETGVEEARWILMGMAPEGSILVVVHALREVETIRIISVRKATPRERKLYASD